MRPETDEQFAAAARTLAGTFLDRLEAMGTSPEGSQTAPGRL
jgi:hypothetical protein